MMLNKAIQETLLSLKHGNYTEFGCCEDKVYMLHNELLLFSKYGGKEYLFDSSYERSDVSEVNDLVMKLAEVHGDD